DLGDGFLARLVEWRWRAAGVSKNHGLIEHDAPRVRARLVNSGLAWLNLLFTAADILIWNHEFREGNEWWKDEIVALDHLSRDLAYMYDRFDHLRILAAQCRTVAERSERLPDAVELAPVTFARQVV